MKKKKKGQHKVDETYCTTTRNKTKDDRQIKCINKNQLQQKNKIVHSNAEMDDSKQ